MKLCATFEIVTPMFLGGAGQQAERIRESSIKGALAFWWRALNFANFFKLANDNLTQALQSMHKKEQVLFGGPKGQGVFLLKVVGAGVPEVLEFKLGKILNKKGDLETSFNTHEAPNVIGIGARYLGYGVLEAFTSRYDSKKGWGPENIKAYAGQLTRSALKANQNFDVQFVFRSKVSETDVKEIIEALKLFGLLGGLGSRVRRGWGSVALTELTGDVALTKFVGEDLKFSAPPDSAEYKKQLSGLIDKQSVVGTNFPLTAFAAETDVRIGQNVESNALTALNQLGIGFFKYRARGQSGSFGGFTVDASFVHDHDWYTKINQFSESRGNYVPMRTAFGLPHNYDSKKFGVTSDVTDSDRRASPLFFHIHKLGSIYVPVVSFFPNLFLPGGVRVWEKKRENSSPEYSPLDYSLDTDIVLDFLNGTKHRDEKSLPEEHQSYFPSEKLWP